jgi:hypothetical protein
LDNQPGEITLDTKQTIYLFGMASELGKYDNFTNQRKVEEVHSGNQKDLLMVYRSLKKDPKNPSNLGNALDVNWTNMCPFLHPPIPLINRVLEKFKAECKEGVIIVPDWPGQKWSVILKELTFKKYVLGQASKVLVRGIKMETKSSKSEKPLCLPPGKLVMYKISNPTLPFSSQNPLHY